MQRTFENRSQSGLRCRSGAARILGMAAFGSANGSAKRKEDWKSVLFVPRAGLRIVLSLNGTGDKNQAIKPLVLSICGGQLSIVTRIWFCDWFCISLLARKEWMRLQHIGVLFSGHFDILQEVRFFCVPGNFHYRDGWHPCFVGVCCKRTTCRVRRYSVAFLHTDLLHTSSDMPVQYDRFRDTSQTSKFFDVLVHFLVAYCHVWVEPRGDFLHNRMQRYDNAGLPFVGDNSDMLSDIHVSDSWKVGYSKAGVRANQESISHYQ